MTDLLKKLKKNSRVDNTSILSDSTIYNDKEMISTSIPAMNIALSGRLDGGLTSGLTIFAGKSKHFKCVDGNTPIEIYINEYEKIETTYKKLHHMITENPNKEFFVKSGSGELSPILATCKKVSDTYTVELSNGQIFKCGDGHPFLTEYGEVKTVRELNPKDVLKTEFGTTEIISKYDFKENQEVYDISIPAPHLYVNIEGGVVHHNSMFSIFLASEYLKSHKDSVMLFYDTEFGTPKSYFESFNTDMNRVLHIPVKDVEELKFDIVNQLNSLQKGEKVVIVVDSIGNLASKKELEDALNEKSVADMSRAKALKGLFRMVTPYLNTKDIPMIAVNHVYSEMGCLSCDTKVKTESGLKNISDIKVGDSVWALNGLKPVTNTFKPKELNTPDKKYYELEFDDGSIIKCSGNHAFLLNDDSWIRADEMKPGIYFQINQKLEKIKRKLIGIKEIREFDLYDISVLDDHCFELENGVIAHNSMFPKDVMSGGSGTLYSANQVFFIGRRQQKVGTDVTGYEFVINVEKSRFVKEKSKIPVTVTWEGGIDKYSALLDLALAGGWVKKPSNGWYQKWNKKQDVEIGQKRREKATHSEEFWQDILNDEEFKTFVKETYTVGYRSMIDMDNLIEEEKTENEV